MYGSEFLWIIALIAIATPILALVAFLRTNTHRAEIGRLRAEVERLREIAFAPQASPKAGMRAASTVQDAPVVARAPEPPPRPAPSPPPPPHAAPTVEAAPRPAPPPPAPPPPRPAPVAEPVWPAAAEPPPPPPRPPMDWGRLSSAFERFVVANWLIWVGALALALGGIFLVRFAWEQGYFGPSVRTIAALVAGVAMIAASEWMRRKADLDAPGQIPYAPLAVATAGAITLYATAYAAGPLYNLVPPGVALFGFVAASVVAIALAVVHGAFLAMLGLIGGFIAPILVGGNNPEPLLVLGYALAVTAAALFLVRVFSWQGIVWVALAGAGLWTFIGATWIDLPSGALALSIYLLALVAASTWLAWKTAAAPVLSVMRQTAAAGEKPALSQTVIAANGFWLLAAIGFILPVDSAAAFATVPLLAAAVGYLAGAIFAASQRGGFELAPLLGAGVAIVLAGVTADNGDILSANGGWSYHAFALAAAIVAGAGGWFVMRQAQRKTILAMVSAFTPLILLAIAFYYVSDGQRGAAWGAAGAILALLNLAVLEDLFRSKGGLDAAKGAGASYALAAFGAAIFSIAASLGGVWMTALFALLLPAIAIVDRRFNLRALKFSTSVAGMIVMARILWPEVVLDYDISTTPVFNELLIIYGAPVVAFWLAARIFERSLRSADAVLVQAFDVAAIAATAAFLSVEIRHLVTGGDLTASYEGLVETSAYAVAWSALALGLAARQGKTPRFWLRIAERVVLAIAAAIAVLGLAMAVNPLLNQTIEAAQLAGPPLFDLITPSYLAPAAILGGYGLLRRRQGHTNIGNAAVHLGLALTLLWATIEVRNVFHDELEIVGEPVRLLETGAYAVVWTAFALALTMLGVSGKRAWSSGAERIVFGLAAAIAVVGLGLALNPLFNQTIEASQLAGLPLLDVITPSYLAPAAIIGCYGLLRRQQGDVSVGTTAAYVGLALTLVWATIEVRNAFHDYLVVSGEPFLLVETGAYVVVWTAFALALAMLGASGTRAWLNEAERFVFGVAVAIAIIGLGVAVNPLNDVGPQSAEADGPVFGNAMTAAYLAPAALLGGYAWLRSRQGRITTGHVAGFTALGLVFLYVTLEVRNFFHADLPLSHAPIGEAESYAYSVTWILFAVVTLFAGIARRRVSIRHAAMAVLALSVVKVFVFDMASLDGVLRAASFFGLGIALIGIALLYQRLIFRNEAAAAGPAAGA